MATYPGDPRARPGRVDCAVSANGEIKRERDNLVGKSVVCSHDGNNHASEPRHVIEALSEQLGIRGNKMKVLKHHPEQYLIIFEEQQDQRRVLHQSRLHHRGWVFCFAEWNEQRYSSVARWDFHVRLRLEGVPVHAWNKDVAAQIIGSHCAIHVLDEKTMPRKRTRTFDLWAWCEDPSKIPREVRLTITDPDREMEDPRGIKHGLSYRVLIHLEVVDDLSFFLGGGAEPGRMRRCMFEWHYGVPDHLGARRERGRAVARDPLHRRRDDHEDHDDDCNDRGRRRHRSRSGWERGAFAMVRWRTASPLVGAAGIALPPLFGAAPSSPPPPCLGTWCAGVEH